MKCIKHRYGNVHAVYFMNMLVFCGNSTPLKIVFQSETLDTFARILVIH